MPASKVLVLAPHPDDEAIGCAGSIYKHTKKTKNSTKIVYITYFDEKRREEGKKAAEILNVSDIEFWDYPPRTLREKEYELTQKLYNLISDYKPEIIFIPFLMDNHVDHYALNRAFINCFQEGLSFDFLIYAYPVWLPLYPNILIDISDAWGIKKASIESYASQASRDYVSMAEALCRYWAVVKGRGTKYIETFFRATKKEYEGLWKRINSQK